MAFDRVVIERAGREPYRTDFLACRHCSTMFYVPEPVAPADHTQEMNAVREQALRYTKTGKRRR